MAMKNTPFGKDRVVKSSESFIEHALTGGHGPSDGIHEKKINRPHQSIMTPVAMDNVDLAMPIRSSILDDESGVAGGIENLEHSLKGASAENEEPGAAGKTKKTIFPNH